MAKDKRFGPEASSEVIHSVGISTGDELAAGYDPCRYIHCNVSGLYRIYDVTGTNYVNRYLNRGQTYGFVSTAITSSSGTPVVDESVEALR